MIYLDHNASAPLLPEVLAAMLPWLRTPAGNASSLHAVGQRAREAVERARAQVARLVGGEAAELQFCSGGTEADVQALRSGLCDPDGRPRGVLVVSAVEHPAVLRTAEALAAEGAEVLTLPVDAHGLPLDAKLPAGTRLVAVMAANNETGALLDVSHWSRKAREIGAKVHCDAVQAAGKVPLSAAQLGASTVALSAHKIGGPQGIGALWSAPGEAPRPLVTGGGQEHGRRSGTENVAGIVGFGVAAELALARLATESARVQGLRDELAAAVCAALPGAVQLGGERRLPNTLSLAIPGVAGEAMVMRLSAAGVMASTGSACSSGSGKPSHVLVAMGLPRWQIKGALRLSLGPSTTAEQTRHAGAEVIAAARALQAISDGAR